MFKLPKTLKDAPNAGFGLIVMCFDEIKNQQLLEEKLKIVIHFNLI